MHPDLARLIRLQELENAAEGARRGIAEIPQKREALEARIAEETAGLEAARQRLAGSQGTRRELEKELGVLQGRLSRFKGQLMEVKTNREYQAVLKEIAAAEEEVRAHEDRILERLLEADELAAAAAAAERSLAETRRQVAEEQQRLERDRTAFDRTLEETAGARASLLGEISPAALSLFEHIARMRRGLAVAEARDGHCSVCHVRLRPQVFNEVRRNSDLIQCESCLRILYFVPRPAAAAGAESS